MMSLVEILQGAHVALAVLQARLLTVITLLLTFALAGWAMWLQTILAAMIALGWGCVIFLPVLFRDRGARDVSEAPRHAESETPGS